MRVNDITFDQETTTTVYGNVYGLSYHKERSDFGVEVFLDCINERVKVLDYKGPGIRALAGYLNYLGRENGFGKVVLVAREEDWEDFVARGYVLEGLIKNYFRGRTGYCMSRFFGADRRISRRIEEEDEILDKILEEPQEVNARDLPEGCSVRTGTRNDIPGLVELFSAIFPSYPTPLNRPDYLEQVMGKKTEFKVIEYQGKLISAASGEMNHTNLSAEITDCATLPDYRGQSLMSHLIVAVEEEMKNRGIKTLYSLSRAVSHGINLVFHRHGYTYGGRLINNCDIMGSFEDMNLWVKKLPRELM